MSSPDNRIMRVEAASGLVRGVCQINTPNQDLRPAGSIVDVLVIHAISLPPGRFGEDWVERLFCNRLPAGAHPYFAEICGLRVSAHFFVRRDGRTIQFVPVHRRAWHAGASSFGSRTGVNDFSVGVELEGCDELPFTNTQYRSLNALTKALMSHFPQLHLENIVGHCDIAPGRKTDPGPYFDWKYYRSILIEGDTTSSDAQ